MNWLPIVCLLIVHITSVSANEVHYHHLYNSVDHFWSYCGQTMWPFDPHTHICCKGYVRPLLGAWYLNKCCGTLNYNRKYHWCCGGKLRRNPLTRVTPRPGCCGRKSYNVKSQTCCNGMVTARRVQYYLPHACCGRTSYNPFLETCCEGQVRSLVGGLRHTRCCGTQSIDNRKQKCCEGVVRQSSDPDVDKCCGKMLYHSRNEVCCDPDKQLIISAWKTCPQKVNENNLDIY